MRAQEIKTKAEKEKEKERKRHKVWRKKRDSRRSEKREKGETSIEVFLRFRSVQIKIVANVFAGGDHDGSRRVTLLAATRGEESGAA